MDSKSKIVIIEETEPIIPVENKNQDNPSEPEYRVISTRRFKVRKFSAKSSLKIVKLLSAKIIPLFDGVTTMLASLSGKGEIGELTADSLLENIDQVINIDTIAKALDMISDEDLDKLIDTALKHCFEILTGNEAQVMTNNGTYGVPNIEDDPIIVMRLTVEAIWFSVKGFFDGNRLGSIMKPLAGSFQSTALM